MSLNWSPLALAPALLAAGMGLAVAGNALAERGEDRPTRGDRVERMAEHLDLSESQRASVDAIFERNRPARQALMERHRTHRDAMHALMPGSADYSTRAQALADEAGTLARDRVLQRTQLQAELATILTPEQFAKMQAHRGHHRPRGHHGREQRGPGPDVEP